MSNSTDPLGKFATVSTHDPPMDAADNQIHVPGPAPCAGTPDALSPDDEPSPSQARLIVGLSVLVLMALAAVLLPVLGFASFVGWPGL